MLSLLCGGSHHRVSTVTIGWNKEGCDPPGDQRRWLMPPAPTPSVKKKKKLTEGKLSDPSPREGAAERMDRFRRKKIS